MVMAASTRRASRRGEQRVARWRGRKGGSTGYRGLSASSMPNLDSRGLQHAGKGYTRGDRYRLEHRVRGIEGEANRAQSER